MYNKQREIMSNELEGVGYVFKNVKTPKKMVCTYHVYTDKIIDLDNLNKLKVSELMSITGRIGNGKKQDYINLVKKCYTAAIKENNREIALRKVLDIKVERNSFDTWLFSSK